MAIQNRTTTITGVFAKDAETTIPTPPVSGTSYRDTSLTEAQINEGWAFKTIVDSSQFNQALYEYSSITKLQEIYGFLPWSSLTDYETGSFCLGTDGNVYQAVQPSGPNSSSYDPVNDTSHTYWNIWLENYQLGIGDVKTSVRTTNHGNWFLCNGQAISRTIYSTLFSIIGTTYGAGDGSTTFNLPNYTNVVCPTSTDVDVKGNGKAIGFTNGTTTGVLHRGSSGTNSFFGADVEPMTLPSTVGGNVWPSASQVIGLVKNASKSGIVASLKSSLKMNYFIRVA